MKEALKEALKGRKAMSSLSVVIPTYKRSAELLRCLDGIDRQELPPQEVVVVCRDGDEASRQAVRHWLAAPAAYGKKMVLVRQAGVLQAMRAGTAAADGEIVVYTDDDAVPRASWLRRLAGHYADPMVGGVGGRDVQPGVRGSKAKVGRITWYGKLVGNHHIGAGPARRVDVLKGVNMSFRKQLAAIPDGLLGAGAQVHFEVHMCMAVSRQGYRLIYDPEAVVDHYPAARFDKDQRHQFVGDAVRDAAYNLQSAFLRGTGAYRRLLRIVYAAAVGDRALPGAGRLLVALLRGEREVARAFLPAQSGQWLSLRQQLLRGKRRIAPPMEER